MCHRSGSTLHQGFLSDYQPIRDKLVTAVGKLGKNTPLFITGHSLGGAQATLANYDMYCNTQEFGLKTPPKSMSFAAPPQFSDASQCRNRNRIRVVTQSLSGWQDALVTLFETAGYGPSCDDLYIVQMPRDTCGGVLSYNQVMVCHSAMIAYWNLFDVAFRKELSAMCSPYEKKYQDCADCVISDEIGTEWCFSSRQCRNHRRATDFWGGEKEGWCSKDGCESLFAGTNSPPRKATQCKTFTDMTNYRIDCRQGGGPEASPLINFYGASIAN